MNKIILVTVIVLSVIGKSWSQSCTPVIGTDSITWYQAREAIDRVDNITIRTLGDTVIANKSFKKVTVDGIIENTKFLLREDTVSGKLWIKDSDHDNEFLLMDLSLNKGDTFKIETFNLSDSITMVDSVYIFNNKKIVQLDFELQIGSYHDKLKFIEGIGPNAGLLYQVRTISDNLSFSQKLICVYNNDINIYTDEIVPSENCIFSGSVGFDDSKISNNYKIFPNPVSDHIHIDNSDNIKCVLEIYNMSGSLIKSCYVNSTQLDIPFFSYEDGLYLLIFRNEKILQMNKIIKVK